MRKKRKYKSFYFILFIRVYFCFFYINSFNKLSLFSFKYLLKFYYFCCCMLCLLFKKIYPPPHPLPYTKSRWTSDLARGQGLVNKKVPKCHSCTGWGAGGRTEKFLELWIYLIICLGKSADGKEKEDFDINTAPTWAWVDLEGWTGQDIYPLERLEPDLQLEGSHLGRGREFYDLEVSKKFKVVPTAALFGAWHIRVRVGAVIAFLGSLGHWLTSQLGWLYLDVRA